MIQTWIIERLDRKLADPIGSNIVEKCDVTLSRAIRPLTSDVFIITIFIITTFIIIIFLNSNLSKETIL